MYIKIYLVLVMTMTLVLGEIGGTNARLAYSHSAYDCLKNPKIFNCKDFATSWSFLGGSEEKRTN